MTNILVPLIALVVAICCCISNVSARVGAKAPSPFNGFRRNLSLRDVPDGRHRRLVRRLADSVKNELFSFHEKGSIDLHRASFESGKLAESLHTAIGGHENLDTESRALTTVALDIGVREFTDDIVDELLRQAGAAALAAGSRNLKLTLSGIFWTSIFILAIVIIVTMSILNIVTAGTDFAGIPWLTQDSDFLKGVPAEDYDYIDPCWQLPLRRTPFAGGTGDLPKFSYLPITGGFIESVTDEILGLFDRRRRLGEYDYQVTKGFDAAIDTWTMRYFTEDDIPNSDTCLAPGEKCFYNAECCTEDEKVTICNGVDRTVDGTEEEQKGTCTQTTLQGTEMDMALEPFCIMWSKTSSGDSIDTFGWHSAGQGWPPVTLDPYVAWIVPWCYDPTATSCTFCETTNGVETASFTTPFTGPLQTTLQLNGFAFSWADDAKLELGENDKVRIWDGFLNRDLVIPDINFWISFTMKIIPEPAHTTMKGFCEKGFGLLSKAGVLNQFQLFLQVKFEVFVGFDKKTYLAEDGTVDDAAINASATGFSDVITGGNATSLASNNSTNNTGESRFLKDLEGVGYDDLMGGTSDDVSSQAVAPRRLNVEDPDTWRLLAESDEEFCLVLAVTEMSIKVPVIGGVNFGRAVGGWCFLSPEDTGVQCTPNGFFLNVEQRLELVGGLSGVLGNFLDSKLSSPPTASDTQGGSFSLGVFLDQDREFQAFVLRVEPPTLSFFGLTAGPLLLPTVHFQLVKGSEVERRRSTLLRTRTSDGNWIPNCKQVGEECDALSGTTWVPFYKDSDEYDRLEADGLEPDTQICQGILLNTDQSDDKLLYYNRILAAVPVPNPDDEMDQFKIQPTFGRWMTPPKYDFSNDLNNNVWIVYFGFVNFGNPLLLLSELSISVVLSVPIGIEEDVATAEDEDALEEREDGLVVFIRLFCRIEILSFVGIEAAIVGENYADDAQNDPNFWKFYFQFSVVALGVRTAVEIEAIAGFDNRRYRHLRESDPEAYHRELATTALNNFPWKSAVTFDCAPGASGCELLAEFAAAAGKALAKAGEKISEFFQEDIVEIGEDIKATLEGWGEDFGEAVDKFSDAAKEVFVGDGLLNLMIPEERRTALVESLRSDMLPVDGYLDVGRLLRAGVILLGLEILEGLSDFLSAFGEIYEFYSDVSKLVVPWDEARISGFLNAPNSCEPGCSNARRDSPEDLALLKEHCWCKDEFNCDVKVPQTRSCKNKWVCDPAPFCWPKVKCGDWSNVATKKTKDGIDFFPLYDGRQFDTSCREEKMIALADVETKQGKMQEKGDIIANNWNNKIKGLFSFTESRRRLSTSTEPLVKLSGMAGSFTLDSTVQTADPTEPLATRYNGITRLPPNSLDAVTKDETDSRPFDRSVYNRGPDGTYTDPESEKALSDFLNKGAAFTVLGDLDPCDDSFLAKNGIIEGPSLSKVNDKPLELSCSDFPQIANAWKAKLASSNPDTLRRRRDRRLQSVRPIETILDRQIKQVVLDLILSGEVEVNVEPGGVLEDGVDAYEEFRGLGLVEGSLSCLDPNNIVSRRRLRRLGVLDMDWEANLVSATPMCSHYEWEIEVIASDNSGEASLIFEVHVPYGIPLLEGLTAVQTRCHDTNYTVEAFGDDSLMTQIFGAGFEEPSISFSNCPNPNLSLELNGDVKLNEDTADACQKEYLKVERTWDLVSSDTTCGDSDVLADIIPFFSQIITLGGLVVNDLPAVPAFGVADAVYDLPNNPSAEVETSVSDFFISGVPEPECGYCEVNYNHTHNFDCSEVGENFVEIAIVNGIGISYENVAKVTVNDFFPPNLITKSPTVFLNRYGVLNSSDVLTVDDVDAGTWDNCEIGLRDVDPTPVYECWDEGPQSTVFTAEDVNGNSISEVVPVTVDDSARKGVGDDRYIDLAHEPTVNLVDQKMNEDFAFSQCNEVAVYVRPEGETNFRFLDVDVDETGFSDWKIPHMLQTSKPDSVLLFEALCEGPGNSGGTECRGEIKAIVACVGPNKSATFDENFAIEVLVPANKGNGTNKQNIRYQTCYRANVIAEM